MRHMFGLLAFAASAAIAGSATAADLGGKPEWDLPVKAGPAPAKPAAPFSCFATTSVVSDSDFPTSGVRATTGPASLSVAECTHVATGWYGGGFLSLPFQDVMIGVEGDAWLGKRFRMFDYFDVDARAAYFYFGIPVLGMVSEADGRLFVSHLYKFGDSLAFKPYVGLIGQRLFELHGYDVAVGAGVEISYTFLNMWGTPELKIDPAVWAHPVHEFAPGGGPIWSVAAKLGYKPFAGSELTIGPQASVVVGDQVFPNDHKPKFMIGAFAFAPFKL